MVRCQSTASLQSATSVGTGRCGRTRSTRPFIALSEKSKLIDTGGANLVHDRHHVTIFGACIAFEVDPLVQLIGKAVFHLAGQISLLHLGVAEEDVAIAS